MGDPYGYSDLRQLISGRPLNPNLPDPLSLQHDTVHNLYDTTINDVFSHGFSHNQLSHEHCSSSVNPATTSTFTTTASDATPFCSLEAAEKGWLGFDGGNNRWPRQETLSLLEIRSRLDSKFRENNQKGALWDEVSRIMAEEYGYQRTGKKCKEKFGNLYKYYKKTKEGKAARQDGKHYRFFRQLEAICGETSTHASTSESHHVTAASLYPTPTGLAINQESEFPHILKCSESLSFSNSSEFETSSSENNEDELSVIAFMMKQSREKQKRLGDIKNHGRIRKSWKAKVEDLVDIHMKKIVETQDAWMEKMFNAIEQREQEMAFREEERKKKESMRFNQEVHKLWAKERAWVEARDAALMEVVKKHLGTTGFEQVRMPVAEEITHDNDIKSQQKIEYADQINRWTELEISNLIQLRTGFELRFQESGYWGGGGGSRDGVWGGVAAKMACLGFDKSASDCKLMWDEICNSLSKTRPYCLGLQPTEDNIL